ncbi:MAG: hypothetical protein ABSG14_05410 [Verrucomicrobiia bacterium]
MHQWENVGVRGESDEGTRGLHPDFKIGAGDRASGVAGASSRQSKGNFQGVPENPRLAVSLHDR